MGKKKQKSTQTNKPVYGAEIRGAHGMLQDAYTSGAPRVQDFADQIGTLLPGYLERAKNGDPAVNAARGYITDTLEGDPAQNPYLDDMIAQTGDNTRRAIQTQLGTRGGIGGSAERDIVSRALSENEMGMRYQDYDREMSRRAQAAGMAPGIAAGNFLGLAPALQVADFAGSSPMNNALKYAAGTGGLLGQYQTVNGQQTQSGMGWGEIIGLGMQAGSMFSDERLKSDIKRVGQTNAGLPIYTYRMGDGPTQMGVMAQEVDVMQPEASGPDRDGYRTVYYGEVR